LRKSNRILLIPQTGCGYVLKPSGDFGPVRLDIKMPGSVNSSTDLEDDLVAGRLRELQRALDESELRYRAVVDSAFDAIISIDDRNLITEFNPGAEAMFGWTRRQVIGRDLAETIIPVALRENHRRGLARHLASPDTVKARARLQLAAMHSSGREFPIEMAVCRIAGGVSPRFTAIIRDISARRAEMDLRRSEARFRDLTELSADWFWEQDENFRFVGMKGSPFPLLVPPYSNILGKTRWDLPGTPILGTWDDHRRTLERRETFREFEVQRVGEDGSPRVLSLSGAPVFDDDGRFTGYRGVGRDITARHRAEAEVERLNAELEARVKQRTAELEAVNAELEAFSYSIAHDLRSPLTSIDGFSYTLSELYGAVLDEPGRHYLDRIRAGVRNMSDLTDAMLSLARLSRVKLRSERVDLATLARATVAQLREAQPQRDATLEAPEHLYARGDPRLLAQVVANLVGNAWKFSGSKAQTHITVASRRGEAGETVYYVADRGAGFDMAYAARLFGAFQRLHGASEFEGTGIGLALVQKIVLRHGGRIWADSSPGAGATFFFTLPGEPTLEADAG
jgi:PAS domain S-box-containing protein